MTADPNDGFRPRNPSGLFPAGPPARPTYREPHPVSGAGVALGGVGAAVWLLLFGLLGTSVRTYAWWTVVAGGLAWLVALLLVRLGDRGVGTGIAIVTGGGSSIAAAIVATCWATSGDWPLW
ncbi:hypothetical protein QTQ03_18285 [Micromonospora sp. WMMA1363]|uniref:hypothetical protein n=1 Tax=Micromonospora sp. WMMA1363 TaxID=3053985 RepID=UPI00259C8F52|nr:hypothetical protein [Micromonospora sp. WMMA1363]MDM4721454.1 hypothetical protein [Micromonospora sp. WMMA1363]